MTRRIIAPAIALTGPCLVVAAVYMALHRTAAYPVPLTPGDVIFAVPFVGFSVMAGLVLRSHPAHPVGWTMAATGVLVPLSLALVEAGRQEYGRNDGAAAALWQAGQLVFKPGFLGIILTLLLFPNGRLPGDRWRVVLIAASLLAFAAEISGVVLPGRIDEGYGPRNGLGVPALASILAPLNGAVGLAVAAAIALASVLSLPVRYRDADPLARRQLQLLAVAAAVMALCWGAGNGVKSFVQLSATWEALDSAALGLSLAGLAVAIGAAVMGGRVIELDVVISRTLTYASLVVGITVLYVAIVAAAGTAAGGRLSLAAAAVLTAVLAVVFEPARKRAQRLADRVVYGPRAEPYDVLASFTRAVSASLPVDQALERMARVLAEGTRSSRAEVWVNDHGDRRLLAAQGSAEAGVATEVEVVHQGQRMGSLRLIREAGRPLNQREERLLSDLAVQAALVFEQARLESELRASRRRLVASQDGERARLERDLHDGAQQHLLALSARLGLLPDEHAAPLRREVAAAIDSLREVARGLYPKLLETGGLKPALSALARRLPMPVRVTVQVERLPRDVEVAIYFCCSEALQNVVKHACAKRASVSVKEVEGTVCVEVSDDGVGVGPAGGEGRGLQNMRDRVEALDGQFEVAGGPDGGTSIRASIPITR